MKGYFLAESTFVAEVTFKKEYLFYQNDKLIATTTMNFTA